MENFTNNYDQVGETTNNRIFEELNKLKSEMPYIDLITINIENIDLDIIELCKNLSDINNPPIFTSARS